MANPQPDKFTKISNELYESIMQTDFSKRQRNILDFVIRMSYGCGKKFAILRPSDFELVGVYKTHIKKELEHLVKASVLKIDGERIELNKNYDEWRISIIKTANQEKYSEVLRRNLASVNPEKVTKTVTNKSGKEITEPVPKVTETVTSEDEGSYQNSNHVVTETVINSYQNSNSQVTKTVTETPEKQLNCAPYEPSKESIKEILNKEKEKELVGDNPFSFYEQNGFGTISPFITDDINYWLDGNFFDEPEQILIKAMQESILNNIRNWKYVNKILLDWCNRKLRTVNDVLAHQQQWELKKQRGNPKNRKYVKQDKLPEWIENKQKVVPVENGSDLSEEQKRKRMEELMQALER